MAGGNGMRDVELTRASYRPERIATLFVGESAPAKGDFFYFGDNNFFRHIQRASNAALQGEGDFLERFKANGWFLDDLVLTPVDGLPPSERKAKCLEATENLAQRIALYQPKAIVSLLVSIREIVERAAEKAGSSAKLYGVPFPGRWKPSRFHAEMSKIVPLLPRHTL